MSFYLLYYDYISSDALYFSKNDLSCGTGLHIIISCFFRLFALTKVITFNEISHQPLWLYGGS